MSTEELKGILASIEAEFVEENEKYVIAQTGHGGLLYEISRICYAYAPQKSVVVICEGCLLCSTNKVTVVSNNHSVLEGLKQTFGGFIPEHSNQWYRGVVDRFCGTNTEVSLEGIRNWFNNL